MSKKFLTKEELIAKTRCSVKVVDVEGLGSVHILKLSAYKVVQIQTKTKLDYLYSLIADSVVTVEGEYVFTEELAREMDGDIAGKLALEIMEFNNLNTQQVAEAKKILKNQKENSTENSVEN